MNQKSILVERPVRYLVIAKRHIADGDIKKVFAVRLFKARDLDSRIGIELPRHASRDAVQLHAVQPASLPSLSGSIPKKLPTPQAGSSTFPS